MQNLVARFYLFVQHGDGVDLCHVILHRGRRQLLELPFRLTHDRFGELIGATRVTTTRLLSKWRQADLVEMSPSDVTMRLSPALIESSPLTF